MGHFRSLGITGLAAALVALLAGAEPSGRVNGSDTRFTARVSSQVGGRTTSLVLTGTAMRRKYGFSVYAIASYVQEGSDVRDAEGLARAAVVKQLHLVFERDVDGAKVADSFRESIGMNHPAPAFGPELARLSTFFRTTSLRRGDHVWLTSLPGVGLTVQMTGKPGLLVQSGGFAQAAWEVYLGPKNLGEAIKSGLSSRL